MWFWILGWLLTVLSIVGNSFLLYLIISRGRLHSSANLFIASLAVADLCAGSTFFPPMFVKAHRKLNLDHPGVLFKVTFTFMYCSTANLCVMTADRYLAITRPMQYNRLMTKKMVICLLCLAWLTPLLLFTLPATFTYHDRKTYTLVVEISRVVIFQIIPCIIFVYVTGCLLNIARQLSRQTADLVSQLGFNHPSKAVGISQNPSLDKRASVAMIVLVITIFNVAHIGANYRCICFISQVCPWEGTIKDLTNFLLIINIAANPFAYAFFKRDIRIELRKIFRRKTEPMQLNVVRQRISENKSGDSHVVFEKPTA